MANEMGMNDVGAKRETFICFKRQYFCNDLSFLGDLMTLRLTFYNSAPGIGKYDGNGLK